MQKKDAIIFQEEKKQMTAKFIKNSQKIPGGKTANFGSRNSNKMIISLEKQTTE